MATSLQVGDILSVRAWTVLDEQAAVNTYNYDVISVSGGAVTDADFAQNWDTTLGGGFYPALMPSSCEYRGVQVYFLKRTAGILPAPVSSVIGAGPGTHGTNPTPRNTCVILKYAGFVRGPGGRGRLFMPFADQAYVATNGRPTVALETLINSFASALLSPITVTVGASSAVFAWGIAHRAPPGPVTINQILTAESADKFGQMHKRGDYGRANSSPI